MKKIICTLCALCALGLTACDDSEDHGSCDASFVDGCQKGLYLKCEFTGTNRVGRLTEHATLTYENITYVCNDDDILVMKDYTCSGGQLKNASGQVIDPICGYDNLIYRCDGDKLISSGMYCDGNSFKLCKDGRLETTECQKGNECVEYVRDDYQAAGCFPSSGIKDGCNGLTDYGSCDGSNVLTFCSNTDPAKGKTLTIDCGSRNESCLLIDKNYGYDCTATCGKFSDGSLATTRGACKDNVLRACGNQKESDPLVPAEWSCSDEGGVCGLDYSNPGNVQFACIKK